MHYYCALTHLLSPGLFWLGFAVSYETAVVWILQQVQFCQKSSFSCNFYEREEFIAIYGAAWITGKGTIQMWPCLLLPNTCGHFPYSSALILWFSGDLEQLPAAQCMLRSSYLLLGFHVTHSFHHPLFGGNLVSRTPASMWWAENIRVCLGIAIADMQRLIFVHTRATQEPVTTKLSSNLFQKRKY